MSAVVLHLPVSYEGDSVAVFEHPTGAGLLSIPLTTWAEMGSPEHVTVTVAPSVAPATEEAS